MRQLKDGEPRYPVEADAIELLRAQPRYEPRPGQKQRVTARLIAEGASPRRARWVSAPVIVALSLCAAGASAAAGGGWVTRGYQALAESLGSTPKRAPAPAPRRGAPVARPKAAPLETNTPPSVPAVSPPVAVPVESAVPVSPLPPPAESRPAPRAAVAPALRPASGALVDKSAAHGSHDEARPERPAPEASNLVMEAMRSLRQEGRPDSAAKQLDEYMRRYPSGALAEEALALSVEAATQRGDARAKELAERYLARYPSGRFRRAAERARALFSK